MSEDPELPGQTQPRLAGSNGDTMDQSECTAFDRDEQFWYDDGSITLVAERVGFRVYRGLLADRSEIFRDLFFVPQPPDAQLSFGCPVIHLSDTAYALREFLDALLRGKNEIALSDMTTTATRT
ncbi:uncharacterized protein C8Q71DRAFT_859077 [Rhodofomes roseus]|uniref:BTB domain-containing protein n=1 Tax=Rhodofomes roseus TaxID=34475 RepID=A0ABQ8KD33_9APHY|nr:uncharacterized protein C8Q71DRAFT_859077 [Rhodofomes roseus]KAH9835452.1 hypothetical protein C8Q71DRAFT_859077 [Rhodofomes roseus]